MCIDCYEESGQPHNWNPAIKETLGLIRELYLIHPTGGPLHAELDDWNIDGTIRPAYEYFDDPELDALHLDGCAVADLPPEAPAVVEGLGRSTRQLCAAIAERLNAMPVDDRYATLAYFDRLIPEPGEVQA